jgi:hypothetical protein
VDDGVLARKDDLADRAGAYFHWFPIPPSPCLQLDP